MHINLPQVLYFSFTSVGAAPRFEKENTKLGAFRFYIFRGAVPQLLYFFLQNLGLFKYKSRGEKGALFLLTRFTIRDHKLIQTQLFLTLSDVGGSCWNK